MVEASGGGFPFEVHVKRYFLRRTGSEAAGIRKALREGGAEKSGQRQIY